MFNLEQIIEAVNRIARALEKLVVLVEKLQEKQDEDVNKKDLKEIPIMCGKCKCGKTAKIEV